MYLLHSVMKMKSRKRHSLFSRYVEPTEKAKKRNHGSQGSTWVWDQGFRVEEDTHSRWKVCRIEVRVIFLKCIACGVHVCWLNLSVCG